MTNQAMTVTKTLHKKNAFVLSMAYTSASKPILREVVQDGLREYEGKKHRLVEFLNEQMDPAEVLAVEIRQYAGQSMKTLVPKVIGHRTRVRTAPAHPHRTPPPLGAKATGRLRSQGQEAPKELAVEVQAAGRTGHD